VVVEPSDEATKTDTQELALDHNKLEEENKARKVSADTIGKRSEFTQPREEIVKQETPDSRPEMKKVEEHQIINRRALEKENHVGPFFSGFWSN
jgi:hypothetical protein